MQSRRQNSSPDIRVVRSPTSQDGMFGVRVQVQGIKGQPFVILNSSDQESPRDVSVITHQAGYNPGVTTRKAGEDRHSPAATNRNTGSPTFNFHKHPEILRPYNPDSNDNSILLPSQVAKRLNGNAPKPRIPLPAESIEIHEAPPAIGQKPPKSPNIVDTDPFMSVGKLISQFNNSQQQRGRRGPRSRLDLEQCRRSRSVDSGRASDSSSSSSSSRASSLRGVRGETPAVVYPPGSARARLLSGEGTVVKKREDVKPSRLTESHGAEIISPQAVRLVQRSVSSRSNNDPTDGSEERDAQQEVTVDPTEDAAKQVLFAYLQEGTTDNDATTEMKVKLLLERINRLKWRTAENVEEEEKNFETEVKVLQSRQTSLEDEVFDLKIRLQVELENEKTLAKAVEKSRTDKKKLQDELAQSQNELSRLRTRLSEMEAQLQTTKHELNLMKSERERSKTEMKDLEQQLSEMHDELDEAKRAEIINAQKEVLLKDMAQLRADFQEVLHAKEEQEGVLYHRERELTALKGALQDEVETHDKYMTALKEEYEQEIEKLLKDLEFAKESNTLLGHEKAQIQEERGTTKAQLKEVTQEKDHLRAKVQDLNNKVDQLNQTIQDFKTRERLLEQRIKQLEREKVQLEETLKDVRRNEEEMCQSNQCLLGRLEEVQGKLTKLNHEHRELKEKLKEERRQIEELWRIKAELEDERRIQDRTIEQLQRKMNSIMEECEASTDVLQSQVDEAKEKSQRELTELRRQLQEKGAELEKSRQAAKKLQEELLPVEEELRRCRREQQEAQVIGQRLEQRVAELEQKTVITAEDRDRQVKLMETRISQLQEDLNDERSSADRLMERLDKIKEQMDQMRTELLQERTLRQDLECDKMSLERQNKDLKCRVNHLEGSQRTNQDSLVSKLNSRIQELEERLQAEESENNSLQQANRRMERKVKEMKMHAEEENINLQTEKDQLTQRLKTAKRQMDEAEEEIERLEHAKKKLQRELDEQTEANEQLLDQMNVLRNELRRKKKPSALIKDSLDDANDLVSD
ncbi:cingulin-like protein 1 isoform X2 [Periophthalmus magnuspinnatus]|uniref:cingulin-like protein 1 isoform X2 n=1 Tax=Periophthalmus magnuspinnatus TaxID=409849 RepID=UPI002436CB56|nr:cingulin-like protein 1 isoform X2 [Periophthalmus magnuspinnatus]